MRVSVILAVAVCLLLVGCRPPTTPETGGPQKPAEPSRDQEEFRGTIRNIESLLVELEGALRLSNADTWSQEASDALRTLGSIRIEIGSLREQGRGVRRLESTVSELEARLKGARPENWSRNAPAAQRAVGDVRIELQNLRRRR